MSTSTTSSSSQSSLDQRAITSTSKVLETHFAPPIKGLMEYLKTTAPSSLSPDATVATTTTTTTPTPIPQSQPQPLPPLSLCIVLFDMLPPSLTSLGQASETSASQLRILATKASQPPPPSADVGPRPFGVEDLGRSNWHLLGLVKEYGKDLKKFHAFVESFGPDHPYAGISQEFYDAWWDSTMYVSTIAWSVEELVHNLAALDLWGSKEIDAMIKIALALEGVVAGASKVATWLSLLRGKVRYQAEQTFQPAGPNEG